MAMNLLEFSPLTVDGSFDRGIIFNKLWLIQQLAQIQSQFDNIVILGSWYGNMSMLLARSDIEYRHIWNIDANPRYVKTAQRMTDAMNLDNVSNMVGDANDLDFSSLGSDDLVINTSCHDMRDLGWFDNIPPGVMVALQSRTDVDDDLSDYRLSRTRYTGTKRLQDPETGYTSLLKIGYK